MRYNASLRNSVSGSSGPERASPGMVERYSGLIQSSGGSVHRQEDWGRRQLAYQSIKSIRLTIFL